LLAAQKGLAVNERKRLHGSEVMIPDRRGLQTAGNRRPESWLRWGRATRAVIGAVLWMAWSSAWGAPFQTQFEFQ
jgi:hypothetical protein